MTTSLLLALALIQAPSAAPQDQQLAILPTEPILAAGIKVEVVEAPAVEAGSEAAPMAPISTASYVGVVPRMSPCQWAAAGFGGRLAGTSPCENLYRWSGSGAFLTGSSYQEWVAWQVRATEDKEAADRAARGRAIVAANAAKATPAATKSSTGTGGGRAYFGASPSATSSAAGGGGTGAGGGRPNPSGKTTGGLK